MDDKIVILDSYLRGHYGMGISCCSLLIALLIKMILADQNRKLCYSASGIVEICIYGEEYETI